MPTTVRTAMRGLVCGPIVPLSWLVSSVTFVMVLGLGALLLRTRQAGPVAWGLFWLVTAATGGWLYYAAFADASALEPTSGGAVHLIAGCP